VPIANYPDGIGTAGPTIDRLITRVLEFQAEVFRNEDGGADTNVQPCGWRVWQLEYDGLTAAEVTTLRTHFNAAKNNVNEFSFYHRQDAVTYSGVKYVNFRVGRHRKTWSNVVSIELGKFI
jgi:hypothetical protein